MKYQGRSPVFKDHGRKDRFGLWEDGEVEEFETRRDGRGIYLFCAPGFRLPALSDHWQMLHHAEEVYELRGEALTYSGWGAGLLLPIEAFGFAN